MWVNTWLIKFEADKHATIISATAKLSNVLHESCYVHLFLSC